MKIYNVEEVYTTSGIPSITYVQPKEYLSLKVALRTAGKCVVVEGPSGIGKTTAVNKLLQELGMTSTCRLLSARKASDADEIVQISKGDFTGTIIIDDFHRLPSEVKENISNVMKCLADESVQEQKIIVVGINKIGDSLVKFSPDLNNRISTIKFETNSDEKVRELILKGEEALNITFDEKNKIIEHSYGSFHIAQLMCQHSCIENEISETQTTHTQIHFSFPVTLSSLTEEFSRSYFDIARTFATGPRLRREGRAPYLHILKWLAESDTWSISISTEIQKHPAQKSGVTQIVEKGFLKEFLDKSKNIGEYLHFDANTNVLSAEDPKFVFYIKALNWNNFAKNIGYLQLVFELKYDFALSFAGQQRDIAQKIFYRLQAREIAVFYDENEEADILGKNVEEYLYPIYNSEAAFVIPLLSQDYPTRIWTKFESKAFKDRFGENSVIPIWFSDVPNSLFDESRKYGGITIDLNADLDSQIDTIIDCLCNKIEKYRHG